MCRIWSRRGEPCWRATARRRTIDDVGRALLARWSEPHRRYHDIDHLRDILGYVDELAEHAADADAVRLAAWYHDAVYEGRPDDEELSARKAEADLAALGAAGGARRRGGAADPDDRRARPGGRRPGRRGALRRRPRLAGGSARAVPAQHRGHPAEYAHVADEAFRSGRARVIGALLAAPALYRTPVARQRWEQAARANLTAELARLTDGQV